MLPQASKELLARMRFFWKPLFQGRYLLLTNTVTCGGMLALGDCVQQSWEIYKDPSKVRSWKRTGERERFLQLLFPGSNCYQMARFVFVISLDVLKNIKFSAWTRGAVPRLSRRWR